MKRSPLLLACLILAACAFRADGEEVSKLPDVSLGDPTLDRALDDVYAQLQTLFGKYYPKAAGTNLHRNGIRFEDDVTTFEFPYTGPPGKKHENTTQRGPKMGGILCHVSLDQGEYRGQLKVSSGPGSTLGPTVIDMKIYKRMFMAPYSAKQDAHLWVRLYYPPDASAEFLKEFVAIITAFEKDGEAVSSQRPSEKPTDVLEGTLRVHPKFHYRYYIDGFGDGQECALFNADDRLDQIKPGSLVRVRGDLASKFFGGGKNNRPTAMVSTWVIYMNVEDVEVLRN